MNYIYVKDLKEYKDFWDLENGKINIVFSNAKIIEVLIEILKRVWQIYFH